LTADIGSINRTAQRTNQSSSSNVQDSSVFAAATTGMPNCGNPPKVQRGRVIAFSLANGIDMPQRVFPGRTAGPLSEDRS